MVGRVVIKDLATLSEYENREIFHETLFSVSRHYLGTICKNSHDFAGTGFSVRYNSMEGCVTCAVESGLAKRRQAAQEKSSTFESLEEGYLRCARCVEILPTENFHKNKSYRTGHSCYCKSCSSINGKESRAKNPELARERSKKAMKARHWSMTLYQGSLSSSRKRGLTHEITQEYIKYLWEKQGGLCYWLGIPMSQDNLGSRVLDKVSLERIDPLIGYTEENTVLVTTFSNLGKSDNSPEDFIKFLKVLCPDAILQAEIRRSKHDRFSKE